MDKDEFASTAEVVSAAGEEMVVMFLAMFVLMRRGRGGGTGKGMEEGMVWFNRFFAQEENKRRGRTKRTRARARQRGAGVPATAQRGVVLEGKGGGTGVWWSRRLIRSLEVAPVL